MNRSVFLRLLQFPDSLGVELWDLLTLSKTEPITTNHGFLVTMMPGTEYPMFALVPGSAHSAARKSVWLLLQNEKAFLFGPSTTVTTISSLHSHFDTALRAYHWLRAEFPGLLLLQMSAQ